MSITSSPEPMELETGHPPSLLSEDVAAEWPIEEDRDTIVLGQFSYSHQHFSEHMQVERDQTRTKILSLTSEDQLSIGENIRPHPAHSEEVLFTCITSNTPSLPPLTSPRRAFSSLPSQLHRDTPSHTEISDTVKINSLYKTTPFLNSNNEPVQHHTNPECEQNSELLHVDLNMIYIDDANDVNVIAELQTPELEATPVDSSPNTVCRRIPSPVITNGTQYEVASDGSCLLKDSFKAHSLDTPPLSSTTQEDLISDPFSSISPGAQINCSASQPTSQLQEKEGESESESSQAEVSLKQPQAECTTYELETPPNDATNQLITPMANENVQPTQTDVCSSPCEFHDCQQDLVAAVVCLSQPQLEYSTSGDLTLVTEIETFSTNLPDSDKKEDCSSDDTPSLPSVTIPPSLRHYIDNPVQDVTSRLHLKKCEEIIRMQQTLRERTRRLKETIAQMEEKILIQQSNTLFSTMKDRWRLNSSNLVPLTHSHLLKLNHTRESEKQARCLKASLKNCRDRMQTGFETESSSEDECYLNSTNLGGPKRRRLTKLHRNWLSERAEIGGRWNWLDLRVAQIDNEILSVNQRLEDIQFAHASQEEIVPSETTSRCCPFTPSTPSRVIHQSTPLKLQSLNNILQSSPHHHSILSLPDDIPSTLLMYDSTVRLCQKDLPLDPKDMRKLEFAISHNKTSVVQGRYKAKRGMSKKIGHRPKLNSQSSKSAAEMSQHKPGKSKPGTTRRTSTRHDMTSITIPSGYLPKPDKPTLKEIVIPGWRNVTDVQTQVDSDTVDLEDTTDILYEVMHSKCEELEIRNYQDALHYSTSSKKLKRHYANALTQKTSSSSYGWSSRRFPLYSENFIEEETGRHSKPADSISPIEDAVFSTPHISHSYKSQQ